MAAATAKHNLHPESPPSAPIRLGIFCEYYNKRTGERKRSSKDQRELPYWECSAGWKISLASSTATSRTALVLLLQQYLCKLQGMPELKYLEAYKQDPKYTTQDKKVLRQVNLRPAQDLVGFLLIDERTLVIAISPTKPVRQVVADIAKPAVMLWTKVPEVPHLPCLAHGMEGFLDPSQVLYVPRGCPYG
ncbi:hypothetical protein VTI74DRAFT_8697 [Chaetomium olivicolor]